MGRRAALPGLRTVRAELDALRGLRPTERGEAVLVVSGSIAGAAAVLTFLNTVPALTDWISGK